MCCALVMLQGVLNGAVGREEVPTWPTLRAQGALLKCNCGSVGNLSIEEPISFRLVSRNVHVSPLAPIGSTELLLPGSAGSKREKK